MKCTTGVQSMFRGSMKPESFAIRLETFFVQLWYMRFICARLTEQRKHGASIHGFVGHMKSHQLNEKIKCLQMLPVVDKSKGLHRLVPAWSSARVAPCSSVFHTGTRCNSRHWISSSGWGLWTCGVQELLPFFTIFFD